jgi:hypothetical protein
MQAVMEVGLEAQIERNPLAEESDLQSCDASEGDFPVKLKKYHDFSFQCDDAVWAEAAL